MKILIGLVSGLVLLFMLVWIIGMFLPEKHRASVAQTFQTSPEKLWHVLIDFQTYPSWRSDIKAVKKLPSDNGYEVWQEQGKHGDVAYATVESTPNKFLVRKIVTQGLPYGGRWSLQLKPAEQGCNLTITEDGEVYNAFFRFMSRYVFGHSASIRKFIQDLEKELR
jgi:hypothetical protein